MAESDKKVVSVTMTGFGPFMDIKTNPSWTVVQGAAKVLSENTDLKLVSVQELTVVYADVSKKVKEMHVEFKPDLAIHVGVAKGYANITIESQSVRSGYSIEDVSGCTPPKFEAVCDAVKPPNECITTAIDTKEIHKHCSDKLAGKVGFKLSTDPGLYLCGFCYYTSLYCNTSALFIHIPDEDEPYSIEEMVKSLVLIVEHAVQQIKHKLLH
ncbi:hypothetical protein LOD99_13240 [Oopsacas minuta]|uniref:Pyroglutamyl-peptidase I n=1 Tax=Oopsacas minuta TaxID=111878 RepID=A0AAV7JBE5_9METZ|nr:hypothetical protein LOD99_13240 [Oopsacas minuta]